MKIIKRNGSEVLFDIDKIKTAITKANETVEESKRLSIDQIIEISNNVLDRCKELNHEINVEDIQDIVEMEILKTGAYEISKNYITYRYTHKFHREASDLDRKILSIVELENEEVKQENSNKNTVINSTQRDYIAGEVSRDISNRLLIDPDIVEAHNKGIIHFHDSDYFIQHMSNCCLINLEDMLQNGTVISGTLIEKPHSFSTACNISTQIIAQIASSQYGGQTISMAHLAPFVDVSRNKIRDEVRHEFNYIYGDDELTDDQKEIFNKIVEERVKKEINKGIQTIQYQILTLLTTNGQTPFISVCLYLNEAKNQQEKDDLALIIEEVIRQRYIGTKNEKGVWITPAFPKLLYFIEEDNCKPGTKYWYLTELAAKCTAKRMVPDYISEKVMKSLKIDSSGKGNAYPSMGCVDKNSIITYSIDSSTYTESCERVWERLSNKFDVCLQPNGKDEYIKTPGVKIWDHETGLFVDQYGMIRNHSNKWVDVNLTGARFIRVTEDHPFEVVGKGVVLAKDIKIGDIMYCEISPEDNSSICKVTNLNYFESEEYSYDVTTESEHFTVNGIWSHNCRSFLTPYIDPVSGNSKYYGRFNQGVVTINLPYIALMSHGDFDKFWEYLDKYLEMCYRALMLRHTRLEGTISDVAPIFWQYGAIARLNKGETIDKLLHGGYSTISLGYAGLYECVKYMTGSSHTDSENGKPFAIKVMQMLNDKCKTWKAKENIDFSVYGTPIESTTYKFAKALKRDFGIIEGITDHNYITNSYHVNVREEIDAFSKLKFESEFQVLSPGGAISYIEVPNMNDNIEAILSVIQFIYDNIMYAEINTKSDYCQVCGYDGEIKIVERDGKLIWECPKCGNTDQNKMSVARRTCGYIGTQFWNQGRTEEIRDRVLHL